MDRMLQHRRFVATGLPGGRPPVQGGRRCREDGTLYSWAPLSMAG